MKKRNFNLLILFLCLIIISSTFQNTYLAFANSENEIAEEATFDHDINNIENDKVETKETIEAIPFVNSEEKDITEEKDMEIKDELVSNEDLSDSNAKAIIPFSNTNDGNSTEDELLMPETEDDSLFFSNEETTDENPVVTEPLEETPPLDSEDPIVVEDENLELLEESDEIVDLDEGIQILNRDPMQVYPDLTRIDLVKSSGQSPPGPDFRYWENFKIEVDWDASSYGNTLVEGDYFIVNLPIEVKMLPESSALNFPIVDPSGATVANAVVTPGSEGGGLVKITFTDFVNNKYNVKGDFYLAAEFNNRVITHNEPTTFTFSIGSQTASDTVIVTGPNQLDDEYAIKWSERTGNPETVKWVIRLNHNKKLSGPVNIKDSLTSSGSMDGIHFITDSFRYQEVVLNEYGNVIGGNSPVNIPSSDITFSNNNTAFDYTLDIKPNQQYLFSYVSTYTPGLVLRNEAVLSSGGKTTTLKSSFHTESSGGTGDGDLLQKIEIIKVDKDDNTLKLPNAVFKITPVAGGDSIEITTNSEGIAITPDKLIAGEYKIEEITAPEGYIKSDEIITVSVSADKATIVTIENEKINTIDVVGTKIWVGGTEPRPTIQLQLYRNGVAFSDPVDLVNGKFTHTWTDLLKYDDEGNEYVYTVDEVNVPDGYTRTGSGLTVINTCTPTIEPETVDITGTKTWVGGTTPRPTILLQLYRNGIAFGNPVSLVDGNTAYTWNNLPKYDNAGNEYVYTVDEVNVPAGYTKTTSGLNVVNRFIPPTEPETVDITGTKTWVGGTNPRPTIQLQLYRNGIAFGNPVSLVDGNTAYTWNNLPKYDNTGNEYVYTVDEVNVPAGYTKTTSGLIVVNRYIPPVTPPDKPEYPPTEPDKPIVPPTQPDKPIEEQPVVPVPETPEPLTPESPVPDKKVTPITPTSSKYIPKTGVSDAKIIINSILILLTFVYMTKLIKGYKKI